MQRLLRRYLVWIVAAWLLGTMASPCIADCRSGCERCCRQRCATCCGKRCSACEQVNEHDRRHARAGYPESISRLAQPSEVPGNSYGWIGGGAALRGEPRYLHEGTWGRDYSGHFFPARIWLDWWHGRRAQGGTGKYETDGPHFLERKH